MADEVEYIRNPLMPSDLEGLKSYIAQELDDIAFTTSNLLTQVKQDIADAQALALDVKIKSEGWKDNFANLTAAATGAGAPALAAFGPSGVVKQREFGIGDSVYVVWHMDHDVRPGSLAHMHVHWSSNGTSTGLVRWEINYTFAKGHQQANFPADSQVRIEQAGAGTAWRHMIAEDQTGFIIPEVDSLIIAEVKRIAPTTGSNANQIFGLFVDIHYQSDRDTTVGKAPPFYG